MTTHFENIGTADEVIAHRRTSPIGSPQRHYLLDPVLVTLEGVCAGVVMIEGWRGTYVYGSDARGEIADFDPVAVAPPGTSTDEVLAVMGYRAGVAPQLRDRHPA